MYKNFLEFEPDTALNLFKKLFHTGIFFLIVPSFFIGNFIAVANPIMVSVPSERPGWFTGKSEPNIAFGFICSLVAFYFFLMLWKITCQLVYIIFRALEKYIESKD